MKVWGNVFRRPGDNSAQIEVSIIKRAGRILHYILTVTAGRILQYTTFLHREQGGYYMYSTLHSYSDSGEDTALLYILT